MTRSFPSVLSFKEKTKLPRRDWILLPSISLLTVCVLSGSIELIARRMFTESRPFIAACMEPAHSTDGLRAIPNTTCRDKKFESDWVEYRFNSCGHRTELKCGPKTPGTYRIVLIGSSYAMGHLTQREKTFASLLPMEIYSQTRRKVELYNQGMVGENPHIVALRMNETLALKPDMILWALSPVDIEREDAHSEVLNPQANSNSLFYNALFRFKAEIHSGSITGVVSDLYKRLLRNVQETKSATLILDAVYRSRNQYLKSSLAGDDSEFMVIPADGQYHLHLQNFDRDIAEVAQQARNAQVPLVVTLLPSRAQAALISMGEWPTGVDPYLLDNDMRAIVTHHGGTYIDILPDYRDIADPEQGFLPIDGHPNALGHATITRFLTEELMNSTVPKLGAPTQPAAMKIQK
jgi:hypothetical protein